MAQEKMTKRKFARRARGRGAGLLLLLGLFVLVPIEARAYVGPGAGITAIGSLLALLGAVFFAIVGFVWYPIKRLRRRRKQKQLGEAPKT